MSCLPIFRLLDLLFISVRRWRKQPLLTDCTVYTIANFGSVILVTVTVTRKMLTMMLSVVAYGHSLTEMQWLGVGLVFGGIGVEARIKHTSEMAKAKEKAAKKVA